MAAATPKTPSDAQPTSENITYEATLNAAASASRFPASMEYYDSYHTSSLRAVSLYEAMY
mgnify:CR=1 FL=1